MYLKKKQRTLGLFFCLFVMILYMQALPPYGNKNYLRYSRFNVAILMQKYNYNTYHSTNLSSGLSFLAAYHQEFALNKMKQKNFISIGVEFLYRSFSFNSYYFKDDSIRLYNGNMNYTYYAKINELNFPLLYKHNFSRENNDVHGVYFSVGYVYRVCLPSYIYVNFNGENQDIVKFRPQFKIGVISPNANSYVHVSLGYQKNHPSGKTKLFAEIVARYGFSPIIIKDDYTPNNLYFGNYFLGFSVGLKWRQ